MRICALCGIVQRYGKLTAGLFIMCRHTKHVHLDHSWFSNYSRHWIYHLSDSLRPRQSWFTSRRVRLPLLHWNWQSILYLRQYHPVSRIASQQHSTLHVMTHAGKEMCFVSIDSSMQKVKGMLSTKYTYQCATVQVQRKLQAIHDLQ